MISNPLSQLRIFCFQLVNHDYKNLGQEEAFRSLETFFRQFIEPYVERGLASFLTSCKGLVIDHKPIVNPSRLLLNPFGQSFLGVSLFLLGDQSEQNRGVIDELLEHDRIRFEKEFLATLLKGCIYDQETRVLWGAPGSWFFYAPNEKIINIELARALIFGLQNSRFIALHEIGHRMITLGCPGMITDLQKEIKKLHEKGGLDRDDIEVYVRKRTAFDYLWRVFQLLEDCAVNLFAQETGKLCQQDLTQAALQIYSISALTEQQGQDSFNKLYPKPRELLEPFFNRCPEFTILENRTKALSMAYPIKLRLERFSQESLNDVLSGFGVDSCDKEILPLLERAILRLDAAAFIQPLFQNSLLERLTRLEEVTQTTFTLRMKAYEEIMTVYFLPLIEKVCDNLKVPETLQLICFSGEEDQDHSSNSNKEQFEAFRRGEPTKSCDSSSGDSFQRAMYDIGGGNTLQELIEAATARQNASKSFPHFQSEVEKIQKEINELHKAKHSCKDPLDDIKPLPKGQETYEDAVNTLRGPITYLQNHWLATLGRVTNSGGIQNVLLPDETYGLEGLDIQRLMERRTKQHFGQRITEEDFKVWKEDKKEESPTINDIVVILDLTGSTYGEVAQEIALGTIVLKESTRGIPYIRFTAIASRGGNPQVLMSPDKDPEEERALLGTVLRTGCGDGDNEIDKNGLLTALQKTIDLPHKKNSYYGKTFIFFLTDGIISQTAQKNLPEALKTLLKNPQIEFHCIIAKNTLHNHLEKSIKDTQWNSPSRSPRVITSPNLKSITKVAINHIKATITQALTKSLSPLPAYRARVHRKKTIDRISTECPYF